MTTVVQLAPASDSEPGGLSFRQVAGLIGVSRSTVVRIHEDGNLPVLKIRGTYRVPRQFVDDLLRALKRPGRCVVFEDFATQWMDEHSTAEAVPA